MTTRKSRKAKARVSGVNLAAELPPDPNVKTLYVDTLRVMVRGDGATILSWYHRFPGGTIEQCRIGMDFDLAKKTITIMANSLGYYPAKPRGKKAKKR